MKPSNSDDGMSSLNVNSRESTEGESRYYQQTNMTPELPTRPQNMR
jgi:hypothetical protein